MKYLVYLTVIFGYSLSSFGQGYEPNTSEDSTEVSEIHQIVITAKRSLSNKSTKPLAGLDDYLEESDAINMIKRGSYASEVYMNGMASERSLTTIDGMRIYSACTDKMDPITSYVEITNLSSANVHTGSSGATGGATIAGTLDLVRRKGSFAEKEFKGMVFSGLESNNWQKVFGTALNYAHPRFFIDFDFTMRDADNYKAAKNKIVDYSQFTKFNTSINLGYKIATHNEIEVSAIYDHAINVGYPALTMDVAFAKAFIGSVEYTQHHLSDVVHLWKTKVYYNTITHAMDDTKRPDVPIRMDMPGWSSTGGFYSFLSGEVNGHSWLFNLNGHHNKSIAEMTMFSNNVGEKDMFMLTWPGVYTNYVDVFGEDNFAIAEDWDMVVSAGVGVHHNQIYDTLGWQSLQIFHPEVTQHSVRFLPRVATDFHFKRSNWRYSLGLNYGERAPSVSEGFGFYLFNSFDRYDYVGNPFMKNEKSLSLSTSGMYVIAPVSIKLSGAYFFMTDYIIGRPNSSYSSMTIGANGVKVYEQLKYAQLLNLNLSVDYRFYKGFKWSSKLGYKRGVGEKNINLPMIQPFNYSSGLAYSYQAFTAMAEVVGESKQLKVNPEFGEQPLAAYAIVNLSVSQRFTIKAHKLDVRAGVENLLDANYTTFADWNRIPRMGRNFFLNVIWSF